MVDSPGRLFLEELEKGQQRLFDEVNGGTSLHRARRVIFALAWLGVREGAGNGSPGSSQVAPCPRLKPRVQTTQMVC